jgi:GT2 family glycosyltransferase
MGQDRIKLNRSTNIELSIIIVSFNTREMILECLRSIAAQTHHTSYEIIVVDNMSTDGSAEAIGREFPNARVMALTENLGFAGANNLAAASACGRQILLLNPDTIVLDGAVDRLVAFSRERRSSRVWGGRTVFGDGSLNPGSCWRKLTVWNLLCWSLGLAFLAPNSPIFNSMAYGGWDRSTVRHVDIVTGCLLLIDREFWNQLGGFDPAFFMYGEEADLCERARQVGAHPIVTPTATIVHYGGASETSSVDKTVKLFRGHMTFIERHWSPATRVLGRALLLLCPLIRAHGYRVAARVMGRPDLTAKADSWRAIWKCRDTWVGGYGLAPTKLDQSVHRERHQA